MISVFVPILLLPLHLLFLLIDKPIRIRIILIAHCDFDLLQYTKHVLRLHQLLLQIFQDAQDQLIKEFPLILEEQRKELSGHISFILRQDRSEQAEDPVAGVHFWHDVVFFKMLVQLWQVVLHQHFDYERMLMEAG